jgi:hypothetical protein
LEKNRLEFWVTFSIEEKDHKTYKLTVKKKRLPNRKNRIRIVKRSSDVKYLKEKI